MAISIFSSEQYQWGHIISSLKNNKHVAFFQHHCVLSTTDVCLLCGIFFQENTEHRVWFFLFIFDFSFVFCLRFGSKKLKVSTPAKKKKKNNKQNKTWWKQQRWRC